MEETDETSAASRFARTTVVLRALGEQIRSAKQLRHLCLTSKLFHSEFVVYLYRELDTPIENLDVANPNLVHTRMLVARSSPPAQRFEEHGPFNGMVQRLLRKMPVLETFVWPTTVELMPNTLDVLRQSCRRLKGIHIYYADPVPGRPRGPDLSGFRNLQYLTLHTFNDGLPAWMAQVARLLLLSPDLKGLDLSVSRATISPPFEFNSKDGIGCFFDRLCDSYAAGGGKPLQLRSLRCGRGIYPKSHSSLAKLTDLAYLEELEITNGPKSWDRVSIFGIWSSDAELRSSIEFESFKPQHCPNLRRLSVSDYEQSVHDYLCAVGQNPAFSTRLALHIGAVSGLGLDDPSSMLRAGSAQQGLPVRLRMLGLDVDGDSRPRLFRGDPSVAGNLDRLVSSNADSLEGLMVNLAERPGGVLLLDIPVGNMDVELCEVHVLKSAVRRLPRLTQLAVNTVSAANWRNRGLVKPGFVFKTAHALAMAGSALAYINICHWFWRVNRHGDGTVELEEMDKREWKSVELFHLVAGRQRSPRNRDEPQDLPFWPQLYQHLP